MRRTDTLRIVRRQSVRPPGRALRPTAALCRSRRSAGRDLRARPVRGLAREVRAVPRARRVESRRSGRAPRTTPPSRRRTRTSARVRGERFSCRPSSGQDACARWRCCPAPTATLAVDRAGTLVAGVQTESRSPLRRRAVDLRVNSTEDHSVPASPRKRVWRRCSGSRTAVCCSSRLRTHGPRPRRLAPYAVELPLEGAERRRRRRPALRHRLLALALPSGAAVGAAGGRTAAPRALDLHRLRYPLISARR